MSGRGLSRLQPTVSVVVPNWNGKRWLSSCLTSLRAQTQPPDEIIVVDNGSVDGSVAYLHSQHPPVRVVALPVNSGFAHAANVGVHVAAGEFVAMINTDVILAQNWLARMCHALWSHPDAASVACKMLQLPESQRVYDAGDVLRRDGACEQRGRFGRDNGQWDEPGTVFGACAGAALYRRAAIVAAGGFDERYFAYLEDVDLALRLRLAGWICRYEPAVAFHAGEGSSHQLRGGHLRMVERNTILLVAKSFPVRWLPLVAYRQLSWAWRALRSGCLLHHVLGAVSAVPMLPGVLRARRELRTQSQVPMDVAVPARPIRGPLAGGHPSQRN